MDGTRVRAESTRCRCDAVHSVRKGKRRAMWHRAFLWEYLRRTWVRERCARKRSSICEGHDRCAEWLS